MKLNNYIDTTSDDYYLNPYKFINKIQCNRIKEDKIISTNCFSNNNDNNNDNDNLSLIIKTLTSIIMENGKLNNNDNHKLQKGSHDVNNNNNNNNENNDNLIIFKLVANNNISKLKNILANNHKLNINLQDNDGDTALHISMFLSNYDACEVLINHNANIFIKDKWGQTPLHRLCFAIENKNIIKIINLIKKKYLTNSKDSTDLKDLMDSEPCDNIFNYVDKYNNTPLHLVIKYILKNNIKLNENLIKVLRLMISLTDVNIINNDGLSISDLINMLNLV